MCIEPANKNCRPYTDEEMQEARDIYNTSLCNRFAFIDKVAEIMKMVYTVVGMLLLVLVFILFYAGNDSFFDADTLLPLMFIELGIILIVILAMVFLPRQANALKRKEFEKQIKCISYSEFIFSENKEEKIQ